MGVFAAILGFILTTVLPTGATMAMGQLRQASAIKRTKHAQERQMALQVQMAEAAEEAEITKLREMTAIQKEKTEQFKASGFQTGHYSGPLFQAVRK